MEEQIENGVAPTEEATAPAQPGTMLREARERLGLSVADAAAQTKLAMRQIEALEADDYGQLPEMAFVRGFVRSYARILHLDEQPLLAALPEAKISAQVSPTSVEVPFPDARSPQMQNLIWLGAALLLSVLVVVFAVWHYTSPGESVASKETARAETAQAEIALPAQMQVIPASAVAETPEPPAKQPEAPAPAPSKKQSPTPVAVQAVAPPVAPSAKPSVSAAPLPAPAAKPTAPTANLPAKPAEMSSASLSLKFGEESWTEVRDANGNVISSQLNPAGSELVLKGQGPLSLVVGRASSTRLSYKGKPVDLQPHTSDASDVARLTLE
jgi:cytoskeleton protein RodZ